jgi:hypothetical protein
VSPTDLLVETERRTALSGKRIGAAVAVGALGALSVAVLTPSVANADVTPASGPIAAENANGNDVYASPQSATDMPNGLFGRSKVTVQVLAVPGSSTGTPSLAGATFTLTAVDPLTLVDIPGGLVISCTTAVNGLCYIPVDPNGIAPVGDVKYRLNQTSAPIGFFPNATRVIVGRCLLVATQEYGQCGPVQPGVDIPIQGTTDNQFVFANQGMNRTLSATVTSTVYPLAAVPVVPALPFTTGLIAGATFELRNLGNAGGPPLATSTSDANGNLTFPGTFAPGDYYLVQTGAAAGYAPVAGQIPVTLPVPDSIAAANTPVVVAVKNAPNIPAPLLVADSTTLTLGSPVVVRDVLANDNLYGADAYILFAKAQHGSINVADAPGCVLPAGQCPQVIRYLADPAYLGADVVTYQVATRGGVSQSTDTVTIVPVPVAAPAVIVATPVVVPVLANTGPQHVTDELAYGGLILAAGLGLTLAGARRRNQV